VYSPQIPGTTPGQRVRVMTVQVEALKSGGFRLSSPQARGWAAVATTQRDLAIALQRGFVEVSCASYARAKGSHYDLDALTTHVPSDPLASTPQRRVRGQRAKRREAYAPEAWTKYDDGRWRSPAGRVYRADSMAVKNVVRKRVAKGLPI